MPLKAMYQHQSGEVNLIDDQFSLETQLKSGFYKVDEIRHLFGSEFKLLVDESIEVPKSAIEIANNYVDLDYIFGYFSPEALNIHQDLNLKHKMGLMFHGKQGTGKTTAAYAIAKELLRTKDAIVVTVTSLDQINFAMSILEKNKPLSNNRMTVIIFDECESDMARYEAEFKRLLDSSSSLDNHLFVFTTNYVKDIPNTILNRPSRIRFSVEFKYVKGKVLESIARAINTGLSDTNKLSEKEFTGFLNRIKSKGVTLDEVKTNFLDYVLSMRMKPILSAEKAKQISALASTDK